jgi:hypothetical protein
VDAHDLPAVHPITGDRLPDAPADVLDRRKQFADLYRYHVGSLPPAPESSPPVDAVEPLTEGPDTAWVRIPVADIRTEVAARVRVQQSAETVDRYAEDMGNGEDLGQVVVFRDRDGTLWLADGLHRLEAAQKQGRTEIEAEVFGGGEREAFLYAAEAEQSARYRMDKPESRLVLGFVVSSLRRRTCRRTN